MRRAPLILLVCLILVLTATLVFLLYTLKDRNKKFNAAVQYYRAISEVANAGARTRNEYIEYAQEHGIVCSPHHACVILMHTVERNEDLKKRSFMHGDGRCGFSPLADFLRTPITLR